MELFRAFKGPCWSLSRIPDIERMFETVLCRTMAAVNAKIGSIMMLDSEKHFLRIVASQGLEESIVSRTSIPVGESISGKVAQTGEAVLVEDVEEDERFSRINNPKYETPSFICMPLKAPHRVIGVLNLSKRGDKRAFSELDLKFLNTLLAHISFAVENARLLKEAKEYARKLQELVQEKSLMLDQAQQQVIQASRLSALGETIAGVAHELNTPLTVVMGYTEMMEAESSDEKIRNHLKKIHDAGERAAKIVKNLLSFARQTPPEKRLANMNDTVSEVLQMCAYDLQGINTEVITDLSPDLPKIMADPFQLQQVFLNIVNNAHQAMSEMPEDIKSTKLTIRTSYDENWLWLEFADTGPGIKQDQIDRVFDPFFTTKAPGKGTGLGLSISYGIVRSHDGDLTVRSVPGRGTTFTVKLPLVSQTPENSESNGSRLSKGSRLGGRDVLVIEDDKATNELMTKILAREGCQVDSALDGSARLKKLKKKEYDLILCDLNMPVMDGKQLFREAKKIDSGLAERFVFITGGIMDQDTHEFLEQNATHCIMKPFAIQAFLEAI